MNVFAKIPLFLEEVRLEIKKVNWPSKNQTIRYTLIVVGASLVIALFLGGIDFALTSALNKLIL